MAESASPQQHPRVTLCLQVEFPDQNEFAQAWTQIPTAVGMFLRTEHRLPLGERVRLALTCPGLLEPLTADAEVVRLQTSQDGVPAGLYVKLWPDGKVGPGASPPKPPTPVEKPKPRSFRILLVEDNPHTTQMYTYALRRLSSDGQDVQVETATHGLEALQRLGQEPGVDLIIADIYMPVMDGLTLLEKMRADPRHASVPVLIISGGDRDAAERAVGLGAQAFIEKPIRIQHILETVRGLLHLKS